MMLRKTLGLVVVTGLLLTGGALPSDKSAAKAATPQFDLLKKLVGDWVEIDKDGKPTDRVVSSMRLTAGGSAVLEIIFPGSPHEMVTVYHQDGADLVLTHFCVLGNQPRMKAEPGTAPNKLVFKFIGGSNIKPEKDGHMNHGSLTVVNENHLQSEWIKCEDGKACYTASFNLARKKK